MDFKFGKGVQKNRKANCLLSLVSVSSVDFYGHIFSFMRILMRYSMDICNEKVPGRFTIHTKEIIAGMSLKVVKSIKASFTGIKLNDGA